MKETDKKDKMTPSAEVCCGQPQTAQELINKYGTFEIQPTADTENSFPAIAQGISLKQGKEQKNSAAEVNEKEVFPPEKQKHTKN